MPAKRKPSIPKKFNALPVGEASINLPEPAAVALRPNVIKVNQKLKKVHRTLRKKFLVDLATRLGTSKSTNEIFVKGRP
jgi:hypothetical protein